MLKIAPFSTVSQTLRDLGYRVQTNADYIYVVKDDVDIFFGTRRDVWNWLIKTKQVKRPW